jgi:hypothetical protein
MAKDASSTRVNANPDSASRNERDRTNACFMGSSNSAGNFGKMRKAQEANTVAHREAAQTRMSRRLK